MGDGGVVWAVGGEELRELEGVDGGPAGVGLDDVRLGAVGCGWVG